MRWSRYSTYFQSQRNGLLLYNSASNSFLQMEEAAFGVIKTISENPEAYDFSKDPGLYFNLRTAGFLVDEKKDDRLYDILKMRRLSSNYNNGVMLLTIAPTRNCNFGCPYCYEKNKDFALMTEETENNIVEFIKRRKSVQQISLVWYGGEPLLAFERILSLNNKITSLGKSIRAMIVTNGYGLNEKVIRELENLHIKTIQITLDGDRETHDSRRFLLGGGKTFDRIVANLDCLLKSAWDGKVNIRMNVDETNKGDYTKVHHFIEERYKDKRISVYPGFVHIEGDETNPDVACCFDSEKKGEFLCEQADKNWIFDLPVFPSMVLGGCTMTKRNAYVIGPEGEIYKCWDDVGIPEKVVGNVNEPDQWNMGLVAEEMIEGSYLEDEECKSCFFFPVCDGGCPRARLANKKKDVKYGTCTYFRSHLEELLELYFEQKERKKVCDGCN